MSFKIMSRSKAIDDSANRRRLSTPHPDVLSADYRFWQQIVASDPVLHAVGAKTVARFFLERAQETVQMGSAATRAATVGMVSSDLDALRVRVSERYAFSRLIARLGDLGIHGLTYADEMGSYGSDSEYRLIVDYDPNTAEGAHALIVDRDFVKAEPFGDDSYNEQVHERWYFDADSGLYIEATNPATPTDLLIENMTAATGSAEAADAAINAADSIQLRPYLSLRLLREPPTLRR